MFKDFLKITNYEGVKRYDMKIRLQNQYSEHQIRFAKT